MNTSGLGFFFFFGSISLNAFEWEYFFGDDDDLLVRASAVLKSQGPENWPHGRPARYFFGNAHLAQHLGFCVSTTPVFRCSFPFFFGIFRVSGY